MAGFFRNNSDEPRLLRSNLPASSGPTELPESAEPAEPAEPASVTEDFKPRTIRAALAPATSAPAADIIPKEGRRAAMNGLDEVERKWSTVALILDSVLAVFVTVYLAAAHPTRTETVHHRTVHVALPDSYYLYAAIIVIICAAGAFGLYHRRRTMVAFAFFLSGFAFTLVFFPIGFALILMGGWLMLRAYRIQKYGTANARQVAREAAARPSRQARRAAATAPVAPSGRSAPSASKRYTPKAPPRKKVPKPTE